MDSMDFRRVVSPDLNRVDTDAMLQRAMGWLRANAPPDYVFSAPQLTAWALANGFTRQVDTAKIADLLRRALPQIQVGPETVAGEVNDMMIALSRYINPDPGASG